MSLNVTLLDRNSLVVTGCWTEFLECIWILLTWLVVLPIIFCYFCIDLFFAQSSIFVCLVLVLIIVRWEVHHWSVSILVKVYWPCTLWYFLDTVSGIFDFNMFTLLRSYCTSKLRDWSWRSSPWSYIRVFTFSFVNVTNHEGVAFIPCQIIFRLILRQHVTLRQNACIVVLNVLEIIFQLPMISLSQPILISYLYSLFLRDDLTGLDIFYGSFSWFDHLRCFWSLHSILARVKTIMGVSSTLLLASISLWLLEANYSGAIWNL